MERINAYVFKPNNTDLLCMILKIQFFLTFSYLFSSFYCKTIGEFNVVNMTLYLTYYILKCIENTFSGSHFQISNDVFYAHRSKSSIVSFCMWCFIFASQWYLVHFVPLCTAKGTWSTLFPYAQPRVLGPLCSPVHRGT